MRLNPPRGCASRQVEACLRNLLEMKLRNSLSVSKTSCRALQILVVYATRPGGVGVGSGEPLALRVAKTGGCGVGSGEPLALRVAKTGGCGVGSGEPLALRVAKTGGCGVGSGEPLALRVAKTGGCGVGRGEPLALRVAKPGGCEAGIGDPLKIATETAGALLLNKCLNELLTGSTIKIAATSKPKRTEMFFIMDEPLLAQP